MPLCHVTYANFYYILFKILNHFQDPESGTFISEFKTTAELKYQVGGNPSDDPQVYPMNNDQVCTDEKYCF